MGMEKYDTRIPEFKSPEEEKEYWEARGPLAKGHRGKLNKPETGRKRSSFLSVRLTGEELTQLRNLAASFNIGPSTFARQILLGVIRRPDAPLSSFSPLSLHDIYEPASDTSKRVSKVLEEINKETDELYDKAKQGQPDALAAMRELLRIYTLNMIVSQEYRWNVTRPWSPILRPEILSAQRVPTGEQT